MKRNMEKIGTATRNRAGEMFKEISKYGLVMAIGFVLLGVIGMVVALGLTVITPLCLGMLGMARSGGESWRWDNLGTGQKAGASAFLVFLLPFVLGGILITLVTAVSYWIDAMIIIMVFSLGCYFWFNRPQSGFWGISGLFLALDFGGGKPKEGISKILGSKMFLLIGVVILMLILIASAFNYTDTAEGYSNNTKNDDTIIVGGGTDPETVVTNDTIEQEGYDETQDEIAGLPLYTNVFIGVYDDLLTRDEDGNVVKSSPANWNIGYSGGLSLDGGEGLDNGIGIPNAKIKIVADTLVEKYSYSIDGAEGIADIKAFAPVLARTNDYGVATIHEMSAGFYDVVITKTGYQDIEYELYIDQTFIEENNERLVWTDVETKLATQSFENKGDFTFIMRPNNYEVNLIYTITEVEIEADTDLTDSEFENQTADLVNEQVAEDINNWEKVADMFSRIYGQGKDVAPSGSYYLGHNLGGVTEFLEGDASKYVITITPTVSSGMYIDDWEIINRNDETYDFLGLPQVGGQQMFQLKNQMQNMMHSYTGALQSVLPALQNSLSGGLESVRGEYIGQRVNYVGGIGNFGSPTVYLKPSLSTMNENGTVPTMVTATDYSTAVVKSYDFMVIGGGTEMTLEFKFTTKFNAQNLTRDGTKLVTQKVHQVEVEHSLLLSLTDDRTLAVTNTPIDSPYEEDMDWSAFDEE